MFLLIPGAIIISMVVYLMTMPVTALVDTDRNIYRVLQPGVFSIQVIKIEDLSMEMRIAGLRIPMGPKKIRVQEETSNVKVKKQSRRRTHSLSAWQFLATRIILAVKVHRFELNIDTDNFVLNAHLFPVLYFASGKYFMNVNFIGQNYFAFTGSVRPIRLIWAYILFQTKQ